MVTPMWLAWVVAFFSYPLISISAAFVLNLLQEKKTTESLLVSIFAIAFTLIMFYKIFTLWIPILFGYGFIYALSLIFRVPEA